MPATPDGRAVLVDPKVAGEVAQLAERGDCECACAQANFMLQPSRRIKNELETSDCFSELNAKSTTKRAENASYDTSDTSPIAPLPKYERIPRERSIEGSCGGPSREESLKMDFSGTAPQAENQDNAVHPVTGNTPNRAEFSRAEINKGVFNRLGACINCLAAPVIKTGAALRSRNSNNGGANSLRVDQFWSEMHEQAESMRNASIIVMKYMNEVTHGKKAEPPPVVAAAMAVAVLLGKESEGRPPVVPSISDKDGQVEGSKSEVQQREESEICSRTDRDCEDAREIVVEISAGIAGGNTDRIKVRFFHSCNNI